MPRQVVPQDAKTISSSQGARRNQGLPAPQETKAGEMDPCQPTRYKADPLLHHLQGDLQHN